MKKLIGVLALGLLFSIISAQKFDNALLNDIKARNIGPGGMSGRVTAIAVDPLDDAHFYIGTASGGIWKTTNGGVNLEPVFDKVDIAGIGALAIDPTNPDIIWAGTGEGNPRNSLTGGYGLYKSLDAGRTWELVGLENTRHIHRVIVDPTDSDVVYVGAIGSPWGAHKERGLYKTSDGGKSWEQILFVNELTGVADMVLDPRNPDKLYVAMWEHLRQPWFFNSGGEGSGLYITLDGGENFKKLSDKDGLPKGELGRIGLAVSKSNPDYVYALVESKSTAIYRSTNGGFNWERRGDENIGNRPFYYAEIYVDPFNENRLYSLYTNVNISEDGGMTFRQLVGRNIHSDHHAWWIHPDNPSFMIDGNDGGMAITYDMGENWRHITNLPVSQFYHIATDNQVPYNVYGGMQDNGSWKGPGYVWSYDGIINEYWDFLIGGDGFDVQADPGNPAICYAMSQQGNIYRINTETGNMISIKPSEEDVKLRWHWNTALALDPNDGNTLYFGSQFVHKSTDRGDSWTVISPDLTTNDTSRQHFDQSGGITYDVTGAETYTCILAIEPSALDSKLIWAGTDDGNIQLTRDGGETWVNCSPKIKDLPDRPWIPQIRASRYNAGEAFVVVNNYRQNDYEPYLYHTTNYGKSWERMVSKEDVPGYVLSFIQDPVEENLMFLGTEFGMYVSVNGGDDWTKFTSGFPNVSTMDLAIQERESDLVIGTFGRSAFILDDIHMLRSWAAQGDKLLEKKIELFQAPDAYMASSKNAPGYYFHGDAYFKGDNRRMGAMLTFYSSTGSEEDKRSKDTVLIKIIDNKGKTLRHLERVPQKGFNRTYWNFDRDGIRLDLGSSGRGRGRRGGWSPGKYPGGGGYVLPGEYTVRAIMGQDSSETKLTIHADPREDFDLNGAIKTQEYVEEVLADLKDFNATVKELKECRGSLNTVKDLAKKSKQDSLLNTIKSIEKELNRFDKELSGESNVNGIYEDESLFIYKVRPLMYMSRMQGSITPNQKIAFEKAKGELKAMDKEIQEFLSNDWKNFKEQVNNTELSFF